MTDDGGNSAPGDSHIYFYLFFADLLIVSVRRASDTDMLTSGCCGVSCHCKERSLHRSLDGGLPYCMRTNFDFLDLFG